jgi:5-methylthioadenosine/S-adenosylhomocysteine deaminase
MLIIRGGRLLDAHAHTAEPTDILIDGDTIREVGRPGLPAPADARTMAADGRILMPGLVNAHTHSHGNLSKGLGDRWTLELLLNAGPWISGNRSQEDKYLAALIGAVEMVRKGCTACYDLFYEFPAPTAEGLEAVGRAYAEVGMRAVVAPMMADRTFYQAIPGLLDDLPTDLRESVARLSLAPWPVSLAATRKALDGWKLPREQVALAVAPTIPLHCSDDFLTGCRDVAREYGVGLHTHVAESKVQAVAGLAKYGKTLTAHLDVLKVLGPNFTAAHGVWLDADDIARLADHGASVAHNPGSNMRLGSGLAAVRAMRERGVNVGIGTDAASCSDNLNMFESMRLASMVSKVQGPDYTRWLTTEDVLEMATIGSARALGFEGRLGRIAPGYKADIVFLDASHINFVPLNDPTNQVVHTEDGCAVDAVIIGGRIVVESGRVTTVDAGKLAAMAETAVARLRAANETSRALAQRLEPVVGTFCRALAGRDYHVQRYGAPTERGAARSIS